MPQNDFSAFNPEVWSKLVIERLHAVNVAMAVCANTDYEGEIKRAGSTVHVRTYGDVTTAPYAKGATINYEALAPSVEPMVVNDSFHFAFRVDDLDNVQSDLPIEAGYARAAASKVSRDIDSKIFSYHVKAHAKNVIGSKQSPKVLERGNANGLNLYSLAVDCGLALDENDAPSEDRWMIIGPAAKAFALKDDDLIKSFSGLANAILSTGRAGMTGATAPNFLGRVGEFDLYWSNNLPKFGAVTANLFGSGKPISYAAKFNKVEELRLQTTFADAYRGLVLHDGEVFSEHSKRLGVLWTS